MQKFAFPLVLGSLVAGSACAQSAVTLYGIVDQSIRLTTNANASNNSVVQLTNGAVTNSRFGLRGEEELGGGMKALFRLENGFDPDTGRVNQNGRLFGRHAYVGLSGGLGTLKLGRQSTEGFNLFGEFDPLTVGNYTANAWPYFMTGGRIDNAVSYDGTFGGLNVGASYGLGELQGNLKQGSYWGARVAYNHGNLGVGAVYQEMRDAASETQRMWGVAGRYAFGPAKLFAGYIGGEDATGMVDGMLNDPSRTVSYGSFAANPRKDMTFYTGLTYQVSGALAMTGVVYHDNIRDVNGVAGQSGKRLTAVLLAEYSLSRRSQLYGTVDYNRVSGAAATELPGRGNQTGVAIGMRHVF